MGNAKILSLPIGDEKKEWVLSKNPTNLVMHYFIKKSIRKKTRTWDKKAGQN
ncbi:MAG: hypothetical protein ABSG44_10955 [Thermodesulfobacteriota bacterium]